jgi:uncharacterized protein YqjF (DUF2071 family)
MSTVPLRTLRRPFLTARWSNLAILTYEVSPALLEPHLPAGLALDTRGGRTFASLVAFDFSETRVRGIGWPGFRRFPEINLRFYVTGGQRRGVVFIRELVPNPLVSWLARAVYHEPYLVASIDSHVQEAAQEVRAARRLRWHGRDHRIEVIGGKPASRPPDDSDEHFFKEHHWGFGRDRSGRTLAYEVQHPVWDVYPVRSWNLELDWVAVYGAGWGTLSRQEPASLMLAVGSPVAVFPRRPL